MIQGIVMKNRDIIITSSITKIAPDDYNDPDLEIIDPYLLLTTSTDSVYIKPYLNDFSDQKVFSFRSEDALTMFSPKDNIIEEYKKNTGVQEQLELNVNLNEDGGLGY